MAARAQVDPPSRRALLAGLVGASIASVAGAFGRVSTARAGVDGDVVLGATNNSASSTIITSSSTTAFGATCTNPGSGVALSGFSNGAGFTYGVHATGTSPTGIGVFGRASASSGATRGVYGESYSPDGSGVYGWAQTVTGATSGVFGRASSPGGTGVIGYSGTGDEPTPVPKTGVYGYAAQDANARGVWGRTVSGRGVFGQASSGQGVRGYSATGSALYGATSGLKKGLALRTIGRVKLDNSAGIATILSGTKSIVVTPGIDLVATSAVTATLMGNPGGTTTVQRVAVDATADTFTIYLTANATANVKVAWHVFG